MGSAQADPARVMAARVTDPLLERHRAPARHLIEPVVQAVAAGESGGRAMPNDSTRTVLVALGAGLGVALAKSGAAVVTGSAALAAAAAHSLADTANDRPCSWRSAAATALPTTGIPYRVDVVPIGGAQAVTT